MSTEYRLLTALSTLTLRYTAYGYQVSATTVHRLHFSQISRRTTDAQTVQANLRSKGRPQHTQSKLLQTWRSCTYSPGVLSFRPNMPNTPIHGPSPRPATIGTMGS